MSLKKREGSPFWWARFKVRGKEHFISTRTTLRRDAEKIERERRAELESAQPAPKQAKAEHGLADVAGLDIDRATAEGVQPEVITRAYHQNWKQLTSFFGADASPQVVTERTLLHYVLHRKKVGVRGQTIRRELTTLKRGLKLAKRAGWLLDYPENWPKVKSDAPNVNQAGKLRDPADVQAWLNKLPAEAKDEALFAIFTALRATELKRVRYEWIEKAPKGSPTPALLRMPPEATKGKYERVVGLSAEAVVIAERAKGRGPHDDGTLFGPETRRNAYRRASAALGIYPIVTLRDLRHSHGSLALANGADLKALMSSMGHKDLDMAARYQHSTLSRTAGAAALATSAFTARVEQATAEAEKQDSAAKVEQQGRSSKKSRSRKSLI